MIIIKEHYRDFIGTLASKIAELHAEIKTWEEDIYGVEDYIEDSEDYEYSAEDYEEYNMLQREFNHLTSIQKFFMETDRWAEFESLDILKLYVEVIEHNYKSMDEYSNTVLPVDGGNTIGITNEEWDFIETTRCELRKKIVAWTAFLNFCKHGQI